MAKREAARQRPGRNYNEKGHVICGGTRRDGGICRRPPTRGRNRCKLHGGHARRGPDHPNWKGGQGKDRWVGILPPGMQDRTLSTINDPERLEATAELGLVDSFLEDAIRKIQFDESRSNMERIRASWSPLYRELKKSTLDRDAIKELSGYHAQVIGMGFGDVANREAIMGLVGKKLSIQESMRRREQELQANIPITDVEFVMAAVADVIQRLVTSASLRRDIVNELLHIMQIPQIETVIDDQDNAIVEVDHKPVKRKPKAQA